MSARAVPFHCPYCGDEDLRPSEEGHGAWECHSCLRLFSVKMLGLLARPGTIPTPGTLPSPGATPAPGASSGGGS